MTFVDMNQRDRAAYFNFHGGPLESARDDFIAAVGRYYAELKACGAFERPITQEAFIGQILERAHDPLAEEVAEYLLWRPIALSAQTA